MVFVHLLPYLSGEVGGTLRWASLGVTGNVATAQLLHRHVLHVEANVVTGQSLGQSLVVHLHGLYLSGDVDRSEHNHHTCGKEVKH